MSALLYGIALQWKLDIRNKGILLTYYIVPLVFFVFMGGIFTSIEPEANQTIIQSMTVFGVTMGAYLGTPAPLVELYSSEIKKAYKVGGIPLWTAALNNAVSGFIHLFIMSMVIYFAAPFVFNAVVPIYPSIYVMNLSLFIAASVSVGTILGLFVKSSSKLTMFSQFIFLPSIMLSGILFSGELLPDILVYAGKIFPSTWGYLNMCKNVFNLLSMLPLAGIMITATVISIWKIRHLKNE
ncbi:ABC transporter permease [Peribacillus sp. FSL H8-0477]|uniref:ABC transporter permease n=1 Tax=Peribacillus sp. FSL H8-0477 TaxID=2921388 RepID=UPI0030FB8E05